MNASFEYCVASSCTHLQIACLVWSTVQNPPQKEKKRRYNPEKNRKTVWTKLQISKFIFKYSKFFCTAPPLRQRPRLYVTGISILQVNRFQRHTWISFNMLMCSAASVRAPVEFISFYKHCNITVSVRSLERRSIVMNYCSFKVHFWKTCTLREGVVGGAVIDWGS